MGVLWGGPGSDGMSQWEIVIEFASPAARSSDNDNDRQISVSILPHTFLVGKFHTITGGGSILLRRLSVVVVFNLFDWGANFRVKGVICSCRVRCVLLEGFAIN